MLAYQLEGIGSYIHEIVRHWLTENPDIKWTLIFDRKLDYFERFDCDRVVLSPKTSHTLSIAYWNEVPLTSWLHKNKPDIYFSPDGFIPLRSNVKCVPVVHDVAALVFPQYMRLRDYLYYRAFQVKMIRRAWCVITVSEFSKTEIIKCAKVSEEKVHAVYNGVQKALSQGSSDEKDLASHGISGPYFIYIGSIHPRKNVHGLLASFRIYREQGGQHDLVLCGRKAWKTQDIDDLLADTVIKEHIHHLDYVPSQALSDLLRGAVALVYVSHYEGFGLPVLEAMAAGVPVITSSNSAMSEFGKDAVLTADPLDHETIADSMLNLESDENLRASLIAKGLEQSTDLTYLNASQKILKIMKSKLYETS